MTIGEKIRELRSKKDITQKKLAEYLGISFQSVSKWENDTALPDVSYIVPLANFFGVTSDEILCNDNKENELREYEFEYLNFMRIAKINEAVSLCRNIIKQYPKNFKWLYNLACALYEVAIHKEKFSREISTSAFKECTDICNRLLDDCTDSEIRYSCRKYLVFLYADNGEYEKAIYEAKKAPSFIDSKEILLDYVGNPDDPIALQRRDDHLLLYISLFCQLLIQMRNDEETIKGIEVATKIWELLVDDKNYLYYCSDMIFYYMKLVDHYAKIENRYKMYENLEKAVSCSKKADNQPDYQVNYTATLIRYAKYDSRCDFNCNKSYSDNLVKHILECPEFDLYRNDLKLKKLLAELK